MSILRNLTSGLRTLFHKQEVEQEMDEELRGFLDAAAREKMRSGMRQDEALRAARVEMGSLDAVKEEMRSSGWESTLETLWQDLRYSLRQLKRNPGFTAVAVLTMALGIGVNTAIFSLVDQLLLWSIPAREPDRLVKLKGGYSDSYPFYCAYRDHNQVFSGMFASSNNLALGIRPEGAPGVEVGHVQYVSGSYFQTLGIGSAAGRVIAPADDIAPGGSPVVVLSYGYWQRRFGGDVKLIGRKLAVNSYPLEIAGIAEKGFGGLFPGQEADAFIPLTMFPVTTPSAARVWNTTHMFWLVTMGRLKPGMSIRQAQAGMQVLWSQAVEAVNGASLKAGGKAHRYEQIPLTLVPGAHATSSVRGGMIDPLMALAMGTGLVLLIACANVANLLLSRAAERRKEIGVRLALGATRVRLIRQLLSESLVLAVAGGTLGLGLAGLGVSALAKARVLDPGIHFRPSLLVLAFSAGITILTGILFGLVPAFHATRMTLAESIKEGAATPGGSRLWLSKALVACQVALSLVLLVTASLFIRTLRNLQNVNLGFQRENIAIFDIDPTNLGYRGPQLRAFYDQLLEHARSVPGVRSAGLSVMTPMGNYEMTRNFSAEGYQPQSGEDLYALSNPISSGYFTTLGIPLLLGRDFRPEDEPAVTPGESILGAIGRSSGGGGGEKPANASRICIINESLARHLYGGANPVGRHVCYGDGYHAERALEIIGVVKDAHYTSIKKSDSKGIIYEASWSNGPGVRWLVVRFAGSEAPIITGVRRALREMDPNVPVLRVRMMEEYLSNAMVRERLVAYLSTFFGFLALGLASVGLYGVLAYAVTQRTREIGIRLALGAQRGKIIGMVMRESLVPVLIGLATGVAAALLLTHLIGNLLYGVGPTDPDSMALAVVAMLTVSLLATAIPARRATKVDPMVALRYE